MTKEIDIGFDKRELEHYLECNGKTLKEFVKWVIIANLIAWPAAYFLMNSWLRNFPYHTKINLIIFVLAGLSSLLITAATVSFQAIKAANANPVDALRYE